MRGIVAQGTRPIRKLFSKQQRAFFAVAAESRGFLTARGVDLTGKQQTKTRTALQYFSKQLAGNSA